MLKPVAPSFEDFGLNPTLLQAVHKKGFEEPTPVQALVIPELLRSDRDIVVQARTGTGKTAAFGLPLIHLLRGRVGSVRALILAPTRELALQVSEELNTFAEGSGLRIGVLYGGQSYTEQLRRLKQGVQIVVGTPGRLLDLADNGKLDLSHLEYLVLDEADEMLNLGFLEDVERIVGLTPPTRRTLLFSATMPRPILEVASRFLKDPLTLTASNPSEEGSATAQLYYEVEEEDKFEALCRIADIAEEFYAIVFCRTKVEVDELSRRLVQRGYDAESLHGDLSQTQREAVLRKFRERRVRILVATDVAARGIDVQDLTHVINYHLPQDSESYIHRIGRTGRAGRSGTAVTLITPSEFRRFRALQRDSRQEPVRSRLPDVESILSVKKQKILNELRSRLQEPIPTTIQEWAREIEAAFAGQDVLAGLLAYAFADKLDPGVYQPLHAKPTTAGANRGPEGTRLYLELGRAHGYTPRKIVELLRERAGTHDHKISDIKVLDRGTFLTVPYREAEFILRKMQGLVRPDRSRPFRPRPPSGKRAKR